LCFSNPAPILTSTGCGLALSHQSFNLCLH
jgi:hypothetical protein